MCDQTSEKVDALEAKFRGDNFLSLFSLAFFGSSLLGVFETSFSPMSDTFTETTKKDMKGVTHGQSSKNTSEENLPMKDTPKSTVFLWGRGTISKRSFSVFLSLFGGV